jgi:plastocyanin
MPVNMRLTPLRTLAAGLGVCVAIGLFACGNGTPGSSTGGGGTAPCNGSAAVTMTGTGSPVMIAATDNLVFVPDSSPAVVGQVVEFQNTGSVVHTVTFQDNNDACMSDPTLAPGATWEVKFTQPGTYNYLCTIHAPNMKGVIHVTGSAAPAGASGASPSASATAAGASPSASATPSPAT